MPSSNSKQRQLSAVNDVDEFNLLQEIPIEAAETLDQLTGRFQSVKDGLPELVKNSKDQYARLQIEEIEDRQIVVIADTAERNLAVIDFAGAPAKNFRGWITWSNPDAGQIEVSNDIEAGHGNGGKAFMVRGAKTSAYMDSCHKGKRTKIGYHNDQRKDRYKPGFARVKGVEINDIDEPDPRTQLDDTLQDLGLTFGHLPEPARQAFEKQNSFTVVKLEKVTEWEGRRKPTLKTTAGTGLVEHLGVHGQAAMTIETCQVWVVRDGEIIGNAPIEPVKIPPYAGFEQTIELEIPDILPDPETDEGVKIYEAGDQKGHLRLFTSRSQMQISAAMKAKNVIRIRNERNRVADWTPQELNGTATSSFIYGELTCAALKDDHLAGAERKNLADTPLVRALKEWTASHVRELAEKLHSAMAENTTPKDRERARSALTSIRELMRQFLEPEASGIGSGSEAGEGATGKGSNGPRVPRSPIEYGTDLHEILLEEKLRDVTLIAGTRIPLTYRTVERTADGTTKPVKDVDVILKSDPVGMFVLNPDQTLTATSAGVGKIWLESTDGSAKSNEREFWTMDASDVSIAIPAAPLKQGQRFKLETTFTTPNGPLDDSLIDCEVLDPSMASVGRSGWMKTSQTPGEAIVRVRFGGAPGQSKDFAIPIGDERVEPPTGTGDGGSDVPDILLCGEDAPGMEDLPPESRTIPGGPEYPTIIEDPLFNGVVWINPNSKEAVRVRSDRGGSSGLGKIGNKTFMHFVALKCFDILKRLYVRQRIAGDSVTEYQYMQYAVDAEMECSAFVDAAWEMTDQLLSNRTGDLDD